MIAGITDNGFIRPELSEIQAFIDDLINSEATDASGNKPNLIAPEPWGVLKGLLVRLLDDGLQREEDAYYAQYISTASGVDLDRVAYPSVRLSAKRATSTALVFTGGASGGTISKDEVFETEDGREYSLDADLTLDLYGDGSGAAHSVLYGLAQNAPIGAVRFIPVPISGMPLLQVTNSAAFLNGDDIESDADFRARAISYNNLEKTSSLPAMEGALAQVDGVTSVLGYENLTEVFDADGVPPGGIVMTVRGGTDADIAEVIFNTKPAGNPSWGTETEDVIDPTTGLTYTLKFSRVSDILIYVNATLTTNADYVPSISDDVIKQQILDYIGGVNPDSETSAGEGIGDDILAYRAEAACYELINRDQIPGLEKVVVTLGTNPASIVASSIAISTTEEAYTDFSSITIL